MPIAEEYVIERQGRKMVLFAGVLDEWHKRYDGYSRSIITELIQAPTKENGNVAITKARARAWRNEGEKFEEFIFDGLGDASSENVSKNILPHIIRMAETRAKARALRDAVNVAEALHDDPSDDEATAKQNGKDLQSVGAASVSVIRDDGVTVRQLEELASLARRRNFRDEAIEKKWAIWERYSYADAAQKIAEQEALLASDGEVHRSG